MIDDFKPARRRSESLETNKNNPSETQTVAETPQKTEPTPFKLPEQVAAEDALPAIDLTLPQTEQRLSRKKSLAEKLKLRWPPTKKEALVSAVIIISISTGIGTFALTQKGPAPVAAEPKVAKAAPKPTTVASMLSGLQVDPSLNARPVIAAMIENSPNARPQSGLGQAGVVFEAVAEGGITRFLALFQDEAPANIGPVRSVRPYYVQWAMGFDAPLAHVGGSPEALDNIRNWGTKDLDQFANSGAYRREASRPAPHNVYTNFEALLQLSQAKGYTGSSFTSFTRKTETASKQPTAKSIDVNISSPLYNTRYDYDAASNSYLRSMAGAAHVDAGTNKQINPKVVVVLVMPYSIAGGKYSNYGTIGSGQVMVFQDGTVTGGTWIKADNASQFSFSDSNGQPLNLNPGQTWITAVGDPAKITYAP